MNKKLHWVLGGILVLLIIIYVTFYVFDIKKAITRTFTKIDALLLGGTPEEVDIRVKNIKHAIDVTLPKIDKLVSKTDVIVDYIDEKKEDIGQIIKGTENIYQTIQQAVPRVNQTLNSINGFVQENKDKLTTFLPKIETAIDSANQSFVSFQSILPSIERSANSVEQLIPKADKTLTDINTFIDTNKDVANTFITDSLPYIKTSLTGLNEAIPKLNSLLTDVEESRIKKWFFGGGAKKEEFSYYLSDEFIVNKPSDGKTNLFSVY